MLLNGILLTHFRLFSSLRASAQVHTHRELALPKVEAKGRSKALTYVHIHVSIHTHSHIRLPAGAHMESRQRRGEGGHRARGHTGANTCIWINTTCGPRNPANPIKALCLCMYVPWL